MYINLSLVCIYMYMCMYTVHVHVPPCTCSMCLNQAGSKPKCTFPHAGNIADWQEGIRKYIMNLQTWLEYAETLNSNLPTRESELSSLLQDIGEKTNAYCVHYISLVYII